MKLKKICLSTQLSDLYGRSGYQSHIEVDREYWCYFSKTETLSEGWYKLKITYIRSGCVFYILPDYPDVSEKYFPLDCYMASTLVFAEIDPIKDLGAILHDVEISKKTYYFDIEHTIVKNWPNEREIDEKELDLVTKVMLSIN